MSPQTDRLTSSPPEILLAILSHLPTASSLHPLSLTSKYLHAFLRTHAATICNTHILTHYSHASSILHSTYSPTGWYLPTHPCVLAEEQRIVRDKILFSGCTCGPCHLVLHSAHSSSSDLSLDQPQGSGMGLNCLTTFRTAGCKARKEIESCIKLSQPGPQYLVFLEKYSWEIETRRAMSTFTSSNSSPTSSVIATSTNSPIGIATGNGDGDGGDAEGEGEGEEEKGKELMFEFMIGNYCVRRFLETSEKRLRDLTSSPSPSSHSATSSTQTTLLSEVKISRLRKKLRKKVRKVEAEVIREEVVDEEVVEERPDGRESNRASPRRRMFGEISSDSNDEKALLFTQKKAIGERWEDGLLWYYGLQGLGSIDSGEDGEEMGEMREKEKKRRGCFGIVKAGFGILGRRVGRWVSGARCAGFRGFRALDG